MTKGFGEKEMSKELHASLTDNISLDIGLTDQLLLAALNEGNELSPQADAIIRAARRYVADIAENTQRLAKISGN